MAAERMTVKQWVHHLEAPDAQLTLSEFMALCLLHVRENGKIEREATEHIEGMIGARDAFDAMMAEHAGVPYPASGKVRALLDEQRDEQRRLAAEGRALGEAS